jgi:phosphopantetheinyl transferase (holo-ACP synthase)
MNNPRLTAGVVVWLALTPALLAAPDYSIKTVADTAPPKQLSDAVRKVLDNTVIQLKDAKDETVVEVWLAKEPAAKATAEQVKNGLTYRELPSSTILGAVRVVKATTDYKKQKIPAGVYTLRLGIQPEDGDHMGTAPYNEFALLCPAAEDKKTDLLETKELRELSAKTTENHPGVWVLFPADKDAADKPKVVSKPGGHWVLFLKLPVVSGDRKATLPFGLNLVGHSSSA